MTAMGPSPFENRFGDRARFAAARRRATDRLLTTLPSTRARSYDELRARYPDSTPDQVAEKLVSSATRASAVVGAATGTWALLPLVPALPLDVAGNSLAIAAIEVRLIAELHQAYAVPDPDEPTGGTVAALAGWGEKRRALIAPGSVALAVSSPLRGGLLRILGRRTLSPAAVAAGAAGSALLNGYQTRRLGRAVIADLRSDPTALTDLPARLDPPTDGVGPE
jgi:hypothetical protein